MAFVCPPRIELLKQRRVLNGIKSVLEELQRDMTAKIQLGDSNSQSKCPPCCPLQQRLQQQCNDNCPNRQAILQQQSKDCKTLQEEKSNSVPVVSTKKPEPPEVMVCYKVPKKGRNKKKKENEVIRLKQSKSRELRASKLYIGCFCEKRDGLQDDCPRTECHGKPECLTQPYPTCGPSEFCDGKHLYKKLRKNQKARAGEVDKDSDLEEEYEYQCFPGTIEKKKQEEFCEPSNCPAYK